MHSIKWYYYVILLIAGAFWGATIPGTKIVMSAGFPVIGVLFWQGVFVASMAGLLAISQRASFKLNRVRIRLCLAVAACGTLLPGLIGFWVIQHLPAGIVAITIAMVPIFVLPIAVALGSERFEWLRVLGVICGAIAIFILVGPEASLPDRTKVIFVIIALAAPLLYALEDNYIAYFGRDDMHPAAILFMAMAVVVLITGPVALARGEWFLIGQNGWGQAELTLFVISVLHTTAYATFIWLIGQTGPIFTSFVAYLVTGFGVLWSMLILGEAYSAWVWLALMIMFVALFLVQPRTQH